MSDDLEPLTTDPNESLDVQLRRLWCEEKRGATYIARKLGITRASVLGRVHRMKKLWEKADPNG